MKEQPELQVVTVPIEMLVPYENNANIHSDYQVGQIVASIEEFGFTNPVLAWENAQGEAEVIAGHGRVLAAKKLGMEELPVIYLNALSDEQRRALTHIDNQLTRNSIFDVDILEAEMAALDFDWESLGFDVGLEFDNSIDTGLSEDYSQNVGKVLYEPKDTQHKVSELFSFDEERFLDMIEAVSDEELKEMLRLRAAWCTDFNFSKIADYYAYHATPVEQRAFAALGLVLLDRDQLIENGFADIVDNLAGGGTSNEE